MLFYFYFQAISDENIMSFKHLFNSKSEECEENSGDTTVAEIFYITIYSWWYILWLPEKSEEDEVLVGAVRVVGDVVVYFYWILDEHVSDDGHHQLRDPVSITKYNKKLKQSIIKHF